MYHEIILRPLYNGLIGIINLIPGIDVGVAVIIFTIIVRTALFPLSKSSLLTQSRMKEIEPESNAIKLKYSNDKQLQAVKIMELYKSKGIKPFSGIILLFIQLPVLFGIISVFYRIIPQVQPDLLYSFVHLPTINPTLFGLDLTHKSIILSIITTVSQYLQLNFSIASRQQKNNSKNNSGDMASQISNSLNSQMKFFLPVVAFFSTYWVIPASFPQAASIIAIYWSVGALFTLVQELYISKKYIKTNSQ